MNIAVVIYSRHLSAEEDYATSIYLNASMFTQIIRDPASPTEEVSTRFFLLILQTAFPNNVLVSKFQDECVERSEERGGVSRALSHLKENDTIRLALKTAVFDRLKKKKIYTTNEILTKRCYRLLIKTLKNNINLWKMAITWPL